MNHVANCQQKKLDSLHNLYTKCKHEDEHKLAITNQLAFVYTNMQLDSAFILAEEAISLSKILKNQKELLTAYNTKAMAFQNEGQNQASVDLCKKVINLCTKSSDKNSLGEAYLVGGGSYFNLGKLDSAMFYYDSALYIFNQTNNQKMLGLTHTFESSINFYNNSNIAISNLKKGISLLMKTKQSDYLAFAYLYLGSTYTSLSMYDSAKYYFQKTLVLVKKSNHIFYLSNVYSGLGTLFANQANYPNAIRNYLLALRYGEIYKCENLIAYSLNNLAWLYREMGDHSKAIAYLKKQQKITNTNKVDLYSKAGLYQEFALVYIAQKKYDTALFDACKMLELSHQLQRKDRIIESYGILAQCFEGLLKFDSAMLYYKRAVTLARQIENQYHIAENLTGLARTLSKIKTSDLKGELLNISSYEARMRNAIKFAEEAYQLSKTSGEIRLQREAALLLSKFYEQQNNIHKAFMFHKLYTTLNDSIMNNEKSNAVANLEFQYETEKKDKEIALLKTQKELNKLQASRTLGISFGLGGALLGIIFVAVVFYMQNKKTKSINLQLESAYSDLKNTQQQLVQSEKLAAFGVMASRVAHEIQNPLNFVNNFSEISEEMLNDFLQSDTEDDKKETAEILSSNLKKINEHGKRADAIVKKLLEHTRAGTAHEFFENE